ncbi:MAG: hypothetical protein IJF78_04575 [Clostridia bacterium]|nr:hypothetical protein [Clostridia bacterium]
MKKPTALLLSLLMLVSCTPGAHPDEQTDTDDDGYRYNMDHVTMEIPVGNINTTLEEIASFGTYAGDGSTSYTAPMTAMTEEKLYVLYYFPDEVAAAGRDAVRAYEGRINTIQIYPITDLTAEPEEITLAFPEGTGMAWSMSVEEATGEIAILAQVDTAIQLQRYASDGSFLSAESYNIGEYGDFTTWIRLVRGDVYFTTYQAEDSAGQYIYHDLWIWRQGEEKAEQIGEYLAGYFATSSSVYTVEMYTEDGTYSSDEILKIYNPNSDKKITQKKFSHEALNWFNASAYDTEADRIWQGASDQLYTCTLEPYTLTRVADGMGAFLEVRDARYGILTVVSDYQKVILYRIPETPKDITDGLTELNFCRYEDVTSAKASDTLESASDPFKILLANGYNMKAATAYASDDTEEYTFTMAKKLMAGDTDFDLFYVTTEMSSLFKEGYFEDLSEYSILDEAYDLLLPGVREICSIGGTEVFVPAYLSTALLAADSTLSPEEFVMPKTFGELMNLRTHPRTEGTYFLTGAVLHNMMYPWFEQTVSNFMASRDFDDVLYDDLVTLYRVGTELAEDPNILIQYEASRKPSLFIPNLAGMIENFGKDRTVLPLVPVREDYRGSVSGEFWAVNPNSPNKEAAVIWLTAYLRMCYKSANTTDAPSYFNIADAEEKTDPATLALREILDDCVRSYEFPGFRMYLYYKYRDIAKGKLTPEQAAQETFNYVKMARDE